MANARVRSVDGLPLAGQLDGSEFLIASQQGTAVALTADKLADAAAKKLPPTATPADIDRVLQGTVAQAQTLQSSALSAAAPGGVRDVLFYSTLGDRGGARYKRVPAEPQHALKFKSTDNIWHEITGPFMYPEQAGAVPGLDVDNADAFDRWLAACVKIGATPRVGSVPFRLNRTVFVPAGLSVLCEPGSEIYNGSTNSPAIQFGDGLTDQFGPALLGKIVFSGAPGVVGVDGQCGLKVKRVQQAQFDHVKCTPGRGSRLFRGVVMEQVSQIEFEVEIQDGLNDGFYAVDAVDLKARRSRSDGNGGNGFKFLHTEGSHLSLSAYGNFRAYHWGHTASGPNKQNFLSNCIGDTSDAENWLIEDLQDTTLVMPWGASQKQTSVQPRAAGFRLRGAAVKGLSFIKPRALNNNGDGFLIQTEDGTGGSVVGPPSRISVYDPQYGSTNTGPGGNGKGGLGWGLNIEGPTLDFFRSHGGTFEGNTSGPVRNLVTVGDVQILGRPQGYKTYASGIGIIPIYNGQLTVSTGLNTPLKAENLSVEPRRAPSEIGCIAVYVISVNTPNPGDFTVYLDGGNGNPGTVTNGIFPFRWAVSE